MVTVAEDSEPRPEVGASATSTNAPPTGAARPSVTVNDCVALKNTVAVEGVSPWSAAAGGVTVMSEVFVIPAAMRTPSPPLRPVHPR